MEEQKIKKWYKQKNYQKIKTEMKQEIQQNPFHVQAWVYLAEALEALGEKIDAYHAYERAHMLDPKATWAISVFERLKGKKIGVLSEELQDLLTVPPVSVCVAMVVKDEERNIRKSIQSFQDIADEIVIVDTGSTDNTVNIVRELGIEPYFYPWNDNFSEVRNFALSKVTSEWVLWIDGDEILEKEDQPVPHIIAGLFQTQKKPILGRIIQINQIKNTQSHNYSMVRFFPTRFGLCFVGKGHEQVAPPNGKIYETLYEKPLFRIRLHHDGYQPRIMKEKRKLERKIRLMRKTIEDDPNNPASWGFLGRELLADGKVEEAIDAFYKVEALTKINPRYALLPEIRGYLITALLARGKEEEAYDIAQKNTQEYPNFPDGHYYYAYLSLLKAIPYLQSAQIHFFESQKKQGQYHGAATPDESIQHYKTPIGSADLYFYSGDLYAAKTLYENVLAKVPPDVAKSVREKLQFIEKQGELLNKKIKNNV